MRLELKNINTIQHADIRLDGLTVIAGENGTGKSTVGKVLFSLIRAMSAGNPEDGNLDNLNSLKNSISRYCDSLYRRVGAGVISRALEDDSLGHYLNLEGRLSNIKKDPTLSDEQKQEAFEAIWEPITRAILDDDSITPRIKKLALDDIVAINNILTSTTGKNIANEFNYYIESEFLNHICSNGGEESEIDFEPDEGLLTFVLKDDSIIKSTMTSDLQTSLKDATYVESPLYIHLLAAIHRSSTYREIDNPRQFFLPMVPIHIKDLANKVAMVQYTKDSEAIKIDVDNGHFVYRDRQLLYERDETFFAPINVASGIKAFGLVQMLLNTKSIGPNNILIWDEPENHLHPKWQIAFAELLVQLAVDGIPILVSTHSPYFLQSIRYHAAKWRAEKFVNYYLAQCNDSGMATFDNVSADLNRIFSLLAQPLNDVMNVDEARHQSNL